MSYYHVFRVKRCHLKTRQVVNLCVFAWRPFAPPHESTTLFMRRLFTSCLSYLCLAGKNGDLAGFRMATFRPAGKDLTNRGENVKGCHVKTRQMMNFRVFAWRPFAPPQGSTRHSMRCVFGYCLSYLCLARRKVAMRKPDKITFWRIYARRPFVFSPRKHIYMTWHKWWLICAMSYKCVFGVKTRKVATQKPAKW